MYQAAYTIGSQDRAKIHDSCTKVVVGLLSQMNRLTLVSDASTFQLYTDSSLNGIRYALFARKNLIHLGSHTLSKWSSSMSSILGELYGVVFSSQHMCHREVVLFTRSGKYNPKP